MRFLTKEQKSECLEFCKTFKDEWDYYVYAYNSDNIFSEKVLKSEAIENKTPYSLLEPKYPVSRWNGKKWEEIKIIVKDDGTLVINPDTYCDRCVKFLSKSDIDKVPHILDFNDEYHRWDIDAEDWVIVGDEFGDLYKNLELKIREIFEIKRHKLFRKIVPAYERDQWSVELSEAKAYSLDKNASTPYIDGILSVLTDMSKDEYVEKILKHDSDEFKFQHGKIHGEMYQFLLKLKDIKNLDDMKIFQNKINSLKYKTLY